MAQSNNSAVLWIAGFFGLIAIATWFATGTANDSPEHHDDTLLPLSVPADLVPAASKTAAVEGAESGVFRIGSQGRLTIEHAALPSQGVLTLDLDLTDELRGSGKRAVRVISTDGRRIDTLASPLPGTESGVRLEIEPGFLSPGLYMIEIDTDGSHPLQIRRYVLELR